MKKSFLVLLTILVVAVLLRIYNLDKVPPSLFGDEVDVGYQAYSLLKTGQDLRGNSWPILIQSLSEYRAPLFIYSAIPFVAIFGLNEWGVRLPAVFWGFLGILGLYLLTRKLYDEKIALFATFFLAISPWHIHYSRASFEVTMLLSFFIFAVYFFLKGLEKKWLLFISALLFALTPYIYSTATIFMPTILVLLIILFRKEIKKDMKPFALAGLILLIVLLPFGLKTFFGQAGERFSIVSIFGSKDLQEKVKIAQQRENLPLEMQRFFHNKPLIWMQNFSINYLRVFSPEFLFVQGDPNARHSIHEMGQMYYYEIILLVIGLWVLIGVENRKKWLILGWLLLSPIPAALTYDGGFHATRNFLMLVPLMVLLALGIPKLKTLKLIILLIFIFNFVFFLHRYFVHYPMESWKAWHFGFKESMQFIKDHEKEYDRIVINNSYEPSLIRFLFWTSYDPAKFHKNFQGDDPTGFSLEKYYFGSLGGPVEEILDRKTLFLASFREDITNAETLKNSNVKLLKEIHSPTGEVIFYLLTGQK